MQLAVGVDPHVGGIVGEVVRSRAENARPLDPPEMAGEQQRRSAPEVDPLQEVPSRRLDAVNVREVEHRGPALLGRALQEAHQVPGGGGSGRGGPRLELVPGQARRRRRRVHNRP